MARKERKETRREHPDFGRDAMEREERARLGGNPDAVHPVTEQTGEGVGFAKEREATPYTEHRPGSEHSDVGRG